MRKRNHSRQAARRPQRTSRSHTLKSLYRRPLRYEPLEDRRLLALVTVNTLSDVTNLSDNLTTLREAIFATNLIGGADTIDFAPALIAGGPGKILLTQGEIKITDALTITGPGANLLTIDATPSDPTPNINNGDGSRVFNIDDGNLDNLILISLRGLTLTGGDVGGSQGGGGIYSTENLVITQSAVSGNAANAIGGGIHERAGTLSLNNSTISGNAAGNQGGGVYFRGDGTVHPGQLIVYQSTVSANKSGAHGGGIFTFRSDTKLTQSTISGNTAIEGGGIFDSGLTAYLSSDTISGNSATRAGGGIRKVGTGSFSISASTLSNNSAGTDGGGISLASGSALGGSNVTLVGNTAAARGGGIASEGILSLRSSTIRDGSATTSGGGVAIIAGTAALSSDTLQHNSSREGGGLDLRGAGISVTIRASTILDNSASNTGGGIYNYNHATLSIADSTLRNNTAAVAGGGLAGLAANTTIFASTFNNNSAPLGGGIAGTSASNVLEITNSTISSNSASDHAAGIFSGGRLTLKHTTVTGNTAAHFAGGVGTYGPTEIGHTIVAGNTSGGNANDLRGNAVLSFSLLGVDTGATFTDNGGNLVGTTAAPIDPKLGPLADNGGPTQTHALLAGSPAINAGDLSLRAGIGGGPTFDQREEKFSRVFGGRIDIGAFEYQALSDLNLVVDTLVDESDGNYGLGDLSLREATEIASKWSGVDSIRFARALTAGGPATILLTKGVLKVTDSVTIMGPGADLLTIDGSGNDPTPGVKDGRGRSVFAATGLRQNINVAMSGLNITGGDSAGSGGGIYGIHVNLSLRQLTITGNAAKRNGGGISLGGGSLVVDNSTISGNSAGGVSVSGGQLTITNSTISGNTGGGVSVSGGQLTMTDSTISGNILTSTQAVATASSGGGIFFYGGISTAPTQLLIDHCTIADNKAVTGGAGIWAMVNSGTITIKNSTIERNISTKARGGGILADASVGTITLEDNTIQGNRVTEGSGGGLYISARSATPTTITRNTIRENSAAFGGGAQFQMLGSELLIDECMFSENSATSPKGSGGGISLAGQSARATIRSSMISANTATGIAGGGGGVAASGVTLKVESSTISGNSANVQGGGISSYSSLEVVDSEISNNRVVASNGRGGGIQLRDSLNISGSTISGNSSAGSGGGIYASANTGQITIMRSQVTNNSAAVDGGGIQRNFGTNVTLYIVDSKISGNTAGRDGGGINVSVAGGAAKISGTSIAGNSAGRSGGGIAKHGTGSLNLWQSTISNNSAVANGGGIMADDGNPWLDSSTVSGNSAGAQGGGLWTAKAADLRYSTIAKNSAIGAGGGIFASSGPLTLVHTIVASNTAPAGRDLTGLIGTVISPSFSLIGSNAGSGLTPAPVGLPDANGNLIGGETSATIIDPMLGPLADNGGFTLPDVSHILTHAVLPGSPAINAGDLNLKAGVDGVPEFDQRGTAFTRVYGGRIDIGAFELQPPPAPAATVISNPVAIATTPMTAEPERPFSPPRRPAIVASRRSDFRPSVGERALLAVATSYSAGTRGISEPLSSAVATIARGQYSPRGRDSFDSLDEAFAALGFADG